jgi:hypothetical protein
MHHVNGDLLKKGTVPARRIGLKETCLPQTISEMDERLLHCLDKPELVSECVHKEELRLQLIPGEG